MDRRSWPWKKKSSPKQSSEATLPQAQHSGSNASPTHRTSRKEDHAAMLKSYAEQLNEACQRYQQAEDKIKVLHSQLADAQKEIGEKESLVKQHVKVAEDAVSGWEKAETEAANTKQELETVLEHKSELEEQVVFLTETMKENQRKAKEELDRKLLELTTKKNKEIEKIKAELEGRLSEVGQRLLESTAECKVLASTLQERMRKIAELNDSRSKAESEIGLLNARLESRDKEAMGLRYEIQVLNKELQIRNEEKDYCKREADVSHRQQLEGVKKIQILEAECQRLRTLVRRKLPGPAAVAQMKQEADTWSRDERRRSLGSKPDRGSKDFQVQLLTERLLSMEEETKMLREVLAQRNCELQAARSPKNNEASAVRATPTKARPVASECSFADEAGSCADAWSSAISELDQFRSKEKSSSSNSPGLLMDDTKFQMMDDFAEMEQLASSSTKDGQQQQQQQQGPKLEELLSEKEKELNAANKLVVDISSKLLATERDFAALKEKNSANEASIVKLQEKLDLLLDSQAEKKNSTSVTVTTEALSANVHKVVSLVEALAQAIGVGDHDESCLTSPSSSSSSSPSHCSFEKLMNVSNRLNEGKVVDLVEFVGELSSVLKNMTQSISSAENVNGAVTRKELSSDSSSNEGLQKENGLLQAEVGKLRHELNRLKTEKEMLQQSCEKAKERIRELESELTQVQGMLSELRTKEAELVSARAEWEERVRHSDSTVDKLREKLAELEGQYQAEMEQHQALLVKYQQIETELNGKGKESYANANNEQSEDIAVKLGECQRTILALGKQLKLLSSPKGAPEATSHSRVNSVSSSLDKQLSSVDDDMEPDVSNNFDQQRWSPTKKFERSSSVTPEQCDSSSWLYSPERTPARTMRSPGRFLSSSHETSELSRTPKSCNNPSSFSRFFSRGRGN